MNQAENIHPHTKSVGITAISHLNTAEKHLSSAEFRVAAIADFETRQEIEEIRDKVGVVLRKLEKRFYNP